MNFVGSGSFHLPDPFVEAARLVAMRGSFCVAPARRSIIRRDAIIVSSLSRPGDDGLSMAMLVGLRGVEPEFFSFAPSSEARAAESDAVNFFASLGRTLVPLLVSGVPGYWPQIVVGSSSDVRHLQALSVRAAGIGDVRFGEVPSDAVIAARYLGISLGIPSCIRFSSAGQQAIVPATDLLSKHYATALSDTERGHLFAHSYCALRDRSVLALDVARGLLATQASHRPMSDTDAVFGNALEASSVVSIEPYARPILRSVFDEISFVLDSIESEIPLECAHLSDLDEIERVQFAFFSAAAEKGFSAGRDLRWKLMGGSRTEGSRVMDFSKSEALGRTYRDLCVRNDPVDRATVRCSENRDLSWGVVLDVRESGFRILLSESSADPDVEEELELLIGGAPKGVMIRVGSVDHPDHDPLARVASCMFIKTGCSPAAGDVVDLYRTPVTPFDSHFRRTAKRRFLLSKWVRADRAVDLPVSAPVPVRSRSSRSGLAESLRSHAP